MGFTGGELGAFERLMREGPSSGEYESGDDGRYSECRTCRYHHPGSSETGCPFRECPYETGKLKKPAGNRRNLRKGGK